MNRRSRIFACGLVLGTAVCVVAMSGANSDETRASRTGDPFTRPLLPAVALLDGTAPVPQTVEPGPVLPELRGILRSGEIVLVNLDGNLVAVGDKIGEYHVRGVEDRGVILSDGDAQYHVTLDDASPRQAAPARGRDSRGR